MSAKEELLTQELEVIENRTESVRITVDDKAYERIQKRLEKLRKTKKPELANISGLDDTSELDQFNREEFYDGGMS